MGHALQGGQLRLIYTGRGTSGEAYAHKRGGSEQRSTGRAASCLRTAVALVCIALIGCGGGNSSTATGDGGGEIVWPDRDGEMSSALPAAVQTGRIVFRSESGESCCGAVDPAMLAANGGAGLAILDDLPPGPATVTVAGFATDFVPAVPDVANICKTIPATAAEPCDPTRLAAAAFESDPLPVLIVASAQTNLDQVPMKALPFLLDFSPAQDEGVGLPVAFAFTVVDAVTAIRPDSVLLEVTLQVEEETDAPAQPFPLPVSQPSFRLLTKRIPIELSACADGTAAPCSTGGSLSLAGFKATGTALRLPDGPVEAHLIAENLGSPPQPLDFRYSFAVVPATALPASTATPVPPAPLAAAGGGEGFAAGGAEGDTPAPLSGPGDRGKWGLARAPTPSATPTPHRATPGDR